MVPPADRGEADRLRGVLASLYESTGLLPELPDENHLEVFVWQLIESQRRIRYIQLLLESPLSATALDGARKSFDPLKGAILKRRSGDYDEACWLVLLSTHFGRNRSTGWQLAGDFYSCLGNGEAWDWRRTSADDIEMRNWLHDNQNVLRTRGGKFGNHRKYESLNAWESTGTGHALSTYVAWIGDRTHAERFDQIAPNTVTRRERFAALYASLEPIARFGRTARFDFLCTLGKIGLLDLEADSAYLSGATGPLTGARLLLDGTKSSASNSHDLERRLAPLQSALDVPFDVLEDALCNWQKSPGHFAPFRG